MKKGLVLEGGGVKGAYQIGAFYAFKDAKIKFDGFVGTSIGSLNASILACGKENVLLDYWYNIEPGKLLGFDKRLEKAFNDDFSIDAVVGAFATLKDFIVNIGVKDDYLRDLVSKLVSYDDLIKSDKDFGLVTCNLSKMKPVYVYKEDIQDQNDLIDHIMASCYLPIFKQKKIIDNSYYVDGGFYDNSPVKLLDELNYDIAYVVNVHGIGFRRKESYNLKTIVIEPSRNNGSILELNRNVIRDNILMGYYDTLRVLKKYDGFKYCFKRNFNFYYKRLIKHIKKWDLRRLKNFFGTQCTKEVVLKAIEYVMEKEGYDYYYVYSIKDVLKELQGSKKEHFVYNFVRKLKFLW